MPVVLNVNWKKCNTLIWVKNLQSRKKQLGNFPASWWLFANILQYLVRLKWNGPLFSPDKERARRGHWSDRKNNGMKITFIEIQGQKIGCWSTSLLLEEILFTFLCHLLVFGCLSIQFVIVKVAAVVVVILDAVTALSLLICAERFLPNWTIFIWRSNVFLFPTRGSRDSGCESQTFAGHFNRFVLGGIPWYQKQKELILPLQSQTLKVRIFWLWFSNL